MSGSYFWELWDLESWAHKRIKRFFRASYFGTLNFVQVLRGPVLVYLSSFENAIFRHSKYFLRCRKNLENLKFFNKKISDVNPYPSSLHIDQQDKVTRFDFQEEMKIISHTKNSWNNISAQWKFQTKQTSPYNACQRSFTFQKFYKDDINHFLDI